MHLNLPEEWAMLADDSRIWIWSSPGKLSESEVEQIETHLGQFVKSWTSHQVALRAVSKVLFNHFVVVVLDQSVSTGASGCSIDALTHEVQGLSQHLGLDLLLSLIHI